MFKTKNSKIIFNKILKMNYYTSSNNSNIYCKLPKIYNEIYEYSQKNQSSITINHLLTLSSFKKEDRINLSAKYLYNEIPIRLARRIKDLEQLPFGLSKTNGINEVRKWYIQSFLDFREYEPTEINNSKLFLNMVNKVYERHGSTIVTMAKGIHEIRKMNQLKMDNVHQLLDRFYSSRIGIRTLLGHFIELFNESPNYFGIICLKTDPKKILEDAIEDASYVAKRNNATIPNIKIKSNQHILFPYIPNHLYYVLFEIIKNAICATNKNLSKTPEINCEINDDKNLIVIKISDNGIGIKKENMNKVWEYSYSTTKINLDEHFESDFSKDAPLSGIGFGIPMSKLYCEYFGGRMEIFSEYGQGTDVYVYLHKKGNFDEPLF